MPTFSALLWGLGVGFIVQMPLGPTAFLCFRRFTVGGSSLAFATGLGTAVGDTVYAAIAVTGVRGVRSLIADHDALFHLGGALVLMLVGIVIASQRGAPSMISVPATADLAGAFGSTLMMALLNPATIAVVGGCIGALGLYHTVTSIAAAWNFVGGFLLGSVAWWLLFAELTALLHRRLGAGLLVRCSRVSGAAIALLGVVLLLSPHR